MADRRGSLRAASAESPRPTPGRQARARAGSAEDAARPRSRHAHPWKESDPRWKQVAEGRWPPSRRPGGSQATAELPVLRRGKYPQQRRHRLYTLRKAVALLGSRSIDRRTGVGRALSEWRRALIDALGGEQVSPQQETIIDLAVRSKLILDSIDAWLLQQPSLIRKKYGVLAPIVLQRQSLADGLARYMGQLGLERRAPKAISLAEYLARPPAAPPSESDGGDDA
jgi:hypothetical protein